MSEEGAANAVLPCNGSRAWAMELAQRRPLGSVPELLAAGDAAWWRLAETDWQEAFATHPRLGEGGAPGHAHAASLRMSAAEQSGLNPEDSAAERLAEGNRAYEAKFGRVFLLRAAGRNSSEVLEILQRRLHNTPEAELQEAAEQQREITQLRLQRWLAEGEERAA